MFKKKNTVRKLFGPYSPIIKTDNLFFLSGQIPVNATTGIIPQGVNEQTTLILENIYILLKKNKLKLKNIVKITIFTTKMDKLNEINLSYKKFFKKNNIRYPARSCIGVSQLPKNVAIEIEAVASLSVE
ncbi:Rid family detoxifying hydrolase [Buchnera aphidicola]|uniref:2-iminobutanoate/2-iminopropanoate deaminase n=1 Tax=Buchnera aphidicola (Cinara strobi) TaxID=1921549 RepID=A0A3B1DWE6_9GAMM|nr:Rid family detoxifying hydrolase [Buchnera aphidicola]VAX76613.1 2-iminobutanoate/2-iminopropanoate deaminase [Buchnera aphidicola (Cinara strobi)]